jgi:outer membrane protein assembly factor BamB
MPHLYRTICIFLLFALGAPAISAQPSLNALCGVVDAIDYPIDIGDTLQRGYDDFGLYRARFGGNHVGIDIGFDRFGEPVHAAARGRVTYADPEGWDTEKGVVLVEHVFPDGSTVYTLYGHMEQTDAVFFPRVNSCVERGDTLGVIGDPSRGRPHLHYEIRNFNLGDGGPGYVTGSPTHAGWFHPLDFTELWRLRLAPAYIGAITFSDVPTLPPIILDTGVFVIASGNALEGYVIPNTSLWRVTADGVITGLVGLPGGRVVARTRSGQMLMLQDGRYLAVWSEAGPEAPLMAFGETLVFLTDGGGIAAYTPTGDRLWELPPLTSVVAAETDALPPRVTSFETNGSEIAVVINASSVVSWRLLDTSGTLIDETFFERNPVLAPIPNDGWLALDGATLYRLDGDQRVEVTNISPVPGSFARMVASADGSSYIYAGDPTSTLLALDPQGDVRWRVRYPFPIGVLPPLLAVGRGCLLYTLDMDGTLNVFSTTDGSLVNQRKVYAGGVQSGSPRARLLRADEFDRILVGGGFLTTVALDGLTLGGEALNDCPLR